MDDFAYDFVIKHKGEFLMNDFSYDFASVIRRIRSECCLNQRDFAKRIGVSQSTICAWERGRNSPHIHNLRRLCQERGISLSYFA